jgi:uncharacterized repeat protein (TIGR01451 family)
VQDGEVKLSDTNGVGIYTPDSNSDFALATYANGNGYFHNGKIYEAIFYQTTLNDAQRRIMSAYLSAKWDKPFATNPTYEDVYEGDKSAHGDYDFFVGGIGQDKGSKQEIGTSQGLTITDVDFLTSDGRFVVAGVNYLLQTPPTGTTTNDLPTGYPFRARRTWYIDRHGDAPGKKVKLSFDAVNLGLPIENGVSYSLMRRQGTSGTFTRVADSTMQGGKVEFDVLPEDGVYTIAKGVPVMHITKSSCVIDDPANGTNHPKRIPGATIRYAIEVNNTGTGAADHVSVEDNLSASLNEQTLSHWQVRNAPCDCVGVTAHTDANSSINGRTVTLDFGTLPRSLPAQPSVKCRYFEAEIR